MKSTAKISENRFLGSISSSSIRNLLPRSISAKQKPSPNAKSFKSNDENAPPVDSNIQAYDNSLQFGKQSSPKSTVSKSHIPRSDGQDEVLARAWPPSETEITGPKTCVGAVENLDVGMKVGVRTGPLNEENESVVDEISQKDDPLGDQIRQLKEELIRAKSDEYKLDGSKSGYFERDSLNQLRVSLNRSLVLPRIDDDDDADEEEANVGVGDVGELNQHLDKLHGSSDENHRDSIQSSLASAYCEADLMSEDEICSQESEVEENDLEKSKKDHHEDGAFRSSISINPCRDTQILKEPILSESPKIRNNRKSMAISSAFLESHGNTPESSNFETLRQTEQIQSSLRSSKLFPGHAESLAASLKRGLQIIDYHQRSPTSNRSSASFSFEHLALKPCVEVDKLSASIQMSKEDKAPVANDAVEQAGKSEKELQNVCIEQAAKIEQLTRLLEQYQQGKEQQIIPYEEARKTPICSDAEDHLREDIKETYEMKQEDSPKSLCDPNEKEALLKEIADLKSKLQLNKSTENLRSSLLSRSIQLRKSIDNRGNSEDKDELEKERLRWTEMESEWISLTDDLRLDIENQRRIAEKFETELKQEKMCTEELNDALQRAVLGHTRFIEQYTELQEKHNDLSEKHRATMEGIAEVKKAAAKAGAKGRHGKRFAKAFSSELSAIRVEKERERELLKKENKSLKAQLRDTAEAVHAAGELLVRLREAEQAASIAEENFSMVQQENEKLKEQLDKLMSKHKTEMTTMKQYLAESRLPESALQPWYREESDVGHNTSVKYDDDDDQAWRAEFGAIYQEHY